LPAGSALLGIDPDGELLLALGAASVVDLLGRIEEVVVGLRRRAPPGERSLLLVVPRPDEQHVANDDPAATRTQLVSRTIVPGR